MDRGEYVETRRKRYLAQTLEEFEETVEKAIERAAPHLPPNLRIELAAAIANHKATVRRKIQALATDCADLMAHGDSALNGFAQELTDRLYPDGRPTTKRSS